MAAQAGHGDFELLFFPWFDHDAYRINPPADWRPNDAIREMGERFHLGRDQMYWAETENTQMAIDDGESVDEICWRFQQEFPSTITEAFRAGRKGGYIKGSVVEKARQRVNAHQGDMPLVIGVDVATGGRRRECRVHLCRAIDRHGLRGPHPGRRGRRLERLHVHAGPLHGTGGL